jgi:hypothetical protein
MWNGVAGALMAGALFIGCGGGKAKQQPPDAGGFSGHVQTGLAGDEPLSALSSDELMQLCEDVTPGFIATRCNALGILTAKYTAIDTTVTDADLAAACRSTVSDCESRGGAGQPDCAAMDTPPSAASCIAIVSDYVACVNASVDAFPTCSQVTRAFLGSDTTVAEPAACQTLDRECPDLTVSPATGYTQY